MSIILECAIPEEKTQQDVCVGGGEMGGFGTYFFLKKTSGIASVFLCTSWKF